MAVYAIGDAPGCFVELMALLRAIDFAPARDRLWFTGDLVNRGPKSLEVLRYVRSLGESAVTVLGNHDLDLLAWLQRQPLLQHDGDLDYTLVHAGLAPDWDIAAARACAAEVEQVLRGDRAGEFFAHMYGDQPLQWRADLRGWPRLRFITNCLTRLRYCYHDGRLALDYKGAPGGQPPGQLPWFDLPQRRSATARVIFGHWSTLGASAGHNVYGLDTGCVWGGRLTALRLDDARWFSVACAAGCARGEDCSAFVRQKKSARCRA